MFSFFSRLNDLEKRIEFLEDQNDLLIRRNNLLVDANNKLNKALGETQDIVALISQGASTLAMDVAYLIEMIYPQSNKKVNLPTVLWQSTDDDEVFN